jgi:hypothetical protein
MPDEIHSLLSGRLRRRREPSAAYLSGPRHGVQAAWLDLRASPSWRARWELASEYVAPPVSYMREVYAPSSRAPLPWLYLKRVVTAGLRRAD